MEKQVIMPLDLLVQATVSLCEKYPSETAKDVIVRISEFESSIKFESIKISGLNSLVNNLCCEA